MTKNYEKDVTSILWNKPIFSQSLRGNITIYDLKTMDSVNDGAVVYFDEKRNLFTDGGAIATIADDLLQYAGYDDKKENKKLINEINKLISPYSCKINKKKELIHAKNAFALSEMSQAITTINTIVELKRLKIKI